jgi:hypothetical protein
LRVSCVEEGQKR